MKAVYNIITICTLLLYSITPAYSQLQLPSVFSDHMVLQRESQANIWGWANAGNEVQITSTWSVDTIRVKADGNGKWKTTLPTHQAGGPYELQIATADKKIILKDILLGDVFLCSGQSNMEWGGNQNLKEILDELPKAKNDHIRLLQVNRIASATPQDNILNSWQTLSAESLKPFSAIGYFIAKNLNQTLHIPIGIINASWGGTGAEVWTPKELIQADKELADNARMQTANHYRPHEVGVLWNSMIAPLREFNLKGFFWYQGESNVGSWSGYDKLMKTLIGSWRQAWRQELPFYFVQIAPFEYNNKHAPLAALLREQQCKTALEVPRTGMVVVTDLVDNIKDIHPTQKKEVAHRLITMALQDIYQHNRKELLRSPIYKNHNVVKDKIEIEFHHLDGKLKIKGKEITDLYIAGSNKVFHPAKGEVKGNKLIVYAREVSAPVAVRFGFTETAMPNLFNQYGLPVSPFRTDN